MTGVAVTTRNRYSVLDYSLKRIVENSPARIVVIDDNSDQPDFNREICEKHGAEYTHNKERLGIPHSKAVGFRMLMDCDRQFWFDDDCFPKVPGWIDAHALSMRDIPHLLYLREWAHIKRKGIRGSVQSYTGATACFMSFTKEIYSKVEGFEKGHGLYGGWHHRLSQRLAVWGDYVSLVNAADYLHSFDMDGAPSDFNYAFMSSLPQHERVKK